MLDFCVSVTPGIDRGTAIVNVITRGISDVQTGIRQIWGGDVNFRPQNLSWAHLCLVRVIKSDQDLNQRRNRQTKMDDLKVEGRPTYWRFEPVVGTTKSGVHPRYYRGLEWSGRVIPLGMFIGDVDIIDGDAMSKLSATKKVIFPAQYSVGLSKLPELRKFYVEL